MFKCKLCEKDKLNEILDFGSQPVCNRFLQSRDSLEQCHQFAVEQCLNCGLIQLRNPAPVNEVRPQHPWITYTEPEEHLDDLTDTILKITNIDPDSNVVGLSFKDDTLLERLRRKGIKNTRRLDVNKDLGLTSNYPGVESIQGCFNSENVPFLKKTFGQPKIIIARHILEHAHLALDFMKSLKQWVRSDGFIVIEAPDCTDALDSLNYGTLWEEHIFYYTPKTFTNAFSFAGLKLAHFENYPYPLENLLIGIAQPSSPSLPNSIVELNKNDSENLSEELLRGNRFSKEFSRIKNLYHNQLSRVKNSGCRMAVFGAGHLTCTFVNLLGLKSYFEFVVDDNPNKKDLFMPGSKLPIVDSKNLLIHKINLCVSTLGKESEIKVFKKNQHYLDQGGIFLSIFSDFQKIQSVLSSVKPRPQSHLTT